MKSNKNYIYGGLLIFNLLTFCSVFLSKSTFLNLVKEDGLFENTGASLFLITAILFFLLYSGKKRFFSDTDMDFFNSYKKRTFFLLLGLLFIFLVGEEISWGQRIFGFETPEGIEARNMQDEFNLHNLDTFHLSDNEDGRKTGIRAYLTAKKIFVYIFVAYLFLLPLGVRLIGFVKKITQKLYMPVPDIGLGVLFIITVLFYKAFKPFANGEDSMLRGLAEVEELNFALILLFLPLIWFSLFPKKTTT